MASASLTGPPRVIQVFLEDGGGGPSHARILGRAIAGKVGNLEVPIDPRSLRRPRGWMDTTLQIVRLASRDSIVHAHGVRVAAAVLPAVLWRRARLVITVHGLHAIRRNPSPVTRLIVRSVLRKADLVLAYGLSDTRTILQQNLAAPSRVRRIHPVFESPPIGDRAEARRRLGLPGEAVVCLWLGRLSQEKDPVAFVRAFQEIPQGNIVGLIVGDGPLRDEMQGEMRLAGLESRVKWLGRLNDPGPAIAAADIFVSTSRWEAFLSQAGLESGSAGLALLLSDVPGNRDFVEEGGSAILVPAGAPGPLAEAIRQLAADPERLRENGALASGLINEAYTPEHLGSDVLAAYREVGSGA